MGIQQLPEVSKQRKHNFEDLYINEHGDINVFMSGTMIYMPLVTNLLYILTQIITENVPILFSGAPGYKSVYREVPTFNQCSEPWSEGVMD